MTLDNLEMLAAFAVVMLVVSLLITILTQMISTLLGLRGTNLRWGLVQLLQTVHPEFEKDIAGIADRVLTHPLISDSAFSRFKGKIPLLGRWQLASAIRVEELIAILERLSAGTVALPPGSAPPAGHTPEQAMATIARDARATAGMELQGLAERVKQFVDAVAPAAAAAQVGGSPGGTMTTAPSLTLQPAINVGELIGKIPGRKARPATCRHGSSSRWTACRNVSPFTCASGLFCSR